MSKRRKLLLRLLHISPKKVPKYFAILSLDKRILQKIYQHLSLVDQVCLSLSCKDHFDLFRTIGKHKYLEFPRLLRIRNPILCVNSPYGNQLLRRLENRRWAYCGECLNKLHPRKEFKRRSLRQAALERCCTSYAGIVDLCPCISLTIRGRHKLIKILRSPTKPAKPNLAHSSIKLMIKGNPASATCVHSALGRTTMCDFLWFYLSRKLASYV